MLFVLSLLACSNSKVPEDALFFDVTVANAPPEGWTGDVGDECHPELTEVPGYQESFTYALAFDGSNATLYIGEDVFAAGTVSGCQLDYTTVIIGEETDEDGPVKWQLTGTARVDPTEGDACVDGEADWEGEEYFEIISSETEALEPGCKYYMFTTGDAVSG